MIGKTLYKIVSISMFTFSQYEYHITNKTLQINKQMTFENGIKSIFWPYYFIAITVPLLINESKKEK